MTTCNKPIVAEPSRLGQCRLSDGRCAMLFLSSIPPLSLVVSRHLWPQVKDVIRLIGAIMAKGQGVGYIRASAADQNTERQLNGIELDRVRELTERGVTV